MVKHLSVSFGLCIIVLIGIIECTPAKKQEQVKKVIVQDMKGESNEKLVKISLNVRDGPDGIPVVDVDSELFEDINDEIFIYVAINKKGKGSDTYNTVLFKQGPTSVCEYFKNPNKEPILKMLLERFKEFGNLDFSCPMPKGKFYMKGFFIDGKTLPSFAPPGDYMVDVAVYRGQERTDEGLIFKFIVYANVAVA